MPWNRLESPTKSPITAAIASFVSYGFVVECPALYQEADHLVNGSVSVSKSQNPRSFPNVEYGTFQGNGTKTGLLGGGVRISNFQLRRKRDNPHIQRSLTAAMHSSAGEIRLVPPPHPGREYFSSSSCDRVAMVSAA